MVSYLRNLLLPLTLITLLPSALQAASEEAPAHPGEWHCIDDHLHEAMALNELRKPLYSMLTNGASEAISASLINSEKKLADALRFTLPAVRPYWALQVPVLCREFVPMSHAPAFSETFSTPLPDGSVKFVDPKKLLALLEASLVFGGPDRLAKVARQEIRKLDKPDHYQCMMKHVLESVVRAAEVADEIKTIASEQGAPSVDWITKISMHSQISLLFTASSLDRSSEPVHRMGIPIICNDVPPILDDI